MGQFNAELTEAGALRIVRLYAWHAEIAPSPVVELNLPAAPARADLLRRLGHDAGAAGAYRRALHLTANPVERRFIERRLDPAQR